MNYAKWIAPLLFFAASAQASTINDVNLVALGFDVQTESDEDMDQVAKYTGTSTTEFGTVGWSTSAFGPLSDIFSTRRFDVGGVVDTVFYQHLHIGNVTIDFDAPITSLLFIAQNDSFANVTGIDLGIKAADFGGDTTETGTAYNIDNSRLGSFVLYVFDDAVTSVTSTYAGINDGFDVVFFANAVPVSADPVPLPGALPLMLAG
ncbi:MAG: hypothetical protein HRU11_00555, partial [Parvularculaceae bacterium]|nr:hypothetical protein [Parvularculaceae bacterium]